MNSSTNPFPLWLKTVLSVFVLAFVLGGAWFYQWQKQTILHDVEKNLLGIAQVKADQIAAWRNDQMLDAVYITKNPFLVQKITLFFSNPRSNATQELLRFLQQVKKEHDYDDIIVLDSKGRTRLSLTGESENYSESLSMAIASGSPAFIDIHTSGDPPTPRIAVTAPVLSGPSHDRRSVGGLVFVNYAERFLYPLIQSWPTPSETAEALLVRRDGDRSLFLSNSRYKPDSALKLRFPVSLINMPSVRAVLGKSGFMRGKDYRGVDVMAAFLPVPDSDWFLVAKMDTDEALAEWQMRSGLIMVIILGLMVLSVAAGLLLYQRNLKAHYRALYRSEAALRANIERQSITLKAIGDAVISTDTRGRVELMNPVAESLTGWTEEEALGRPLEEVFNIINEETREKVENPVVMVLREGTVVGLANHTLLISRDGREIPIADSGAPIRNPEGEITGVVLVFRDQSSERLVRKMADLRLRLFKYAAKHGLDDLLTRTLDEAAELVNSPIGFYHFVDSDQNNLTIQQWSTSTLRDFCQATGKGHHLPVDQAGVWADCIRQKRPLIYNDYPSLSGIKGLPEGHAPVKRILEVPVIREDRVVAILGVGNKPEEYTERDLEMVSYLADVTWEIVQQKRVEEALRLTQFAIDNTIDAAYWMGPDGRFFYVNDAACKALGYSREELLTMSVHDISPGCTDEFWTKHWKELRKRKSFVFEAVHRRRNGSVFPVEISANHIQFGEREFNCAFARNISDRKKTEERLERFGRIFEESLNEIYLFNAETLKFVQVNRAAQQNLGYTMEELRDMTPLDLKPEFTPESFATLVEPLRKGEKKKIVFETVHKRKDSSLYTVEVHLQLLKAGPETLFVAIILDITRKMQAEEERKRLEEQLFQIQKLESIGRLAGGVAHDFNNILSAIIGNAELAMMKLEKDDPLYERIQQILHAANRSKDITQQLLAFARKQTISPRVIDMNETVEGMLKMLRRLIGEDIELLWKPGHSVWPVNTDPSQIDQILANLILNASDAISGPGSITIETGNVTFDDTYAKEHAGSRPGDFVMLAVSDNGCGMDQETLACIFEPFFTTKERGKGTGLGLATVYGIVRQNNGFVNAYSEPEQGTTIKIYLPRHTGESAERETESSLSIEIPKSNGEVVLLVEDDEVTMDVARMMLNELGYRVISAGTPADALRLANEHDDELHLLLTDVIMPGMNGRELSRELQSLYPDLKVLFMSGYTDNVIAHQGVLEAGVHFLQKPFNLQTLAFRLREVLDEE